MFKSFVKSVGVRALPILILAGGYVPSLQAQQPVEVRFKALVGEQPLACGKQYDGVGFANSKIEPRDFRFYIRDLRVVDDKGAQIPVDLEQDGKWQLDGITLLDFEDRTGSCVQGTPDMNDKIKGTVPSGTVVRGIRFRLGVTPERNRAPNIRSAPAPLNLTALIWSWAQGYLFLRMDFVRLGANSSSLAVHVGDSMPGSVWPDMEFLNFDPAKDAIAADLGSLLKPVNVEQVGGCMGTCVRMFTGLGIDSTVPQTFFRKVVASEAPKASESK